MVRSVFVPALAPGLLTGTARGQMVREVIVEQAIPPEGAMVPILEHTGQPVPVEGTYPRAEAPIQAEELVGIDAVGSRRCEVRPEEGRATATVWSEGGRHWRRRQPLDDLGPARPNPEGSNTSFAPDAEVFLVRGGPVGPRVLIDAAIPDGCDAVCNLTIPRRARLVPATLTNQGR